MGTPLIEQQIYLLERYTSLDYFGRMRDAFRAMVRAGWAALDEFMRHLPRDYRDGHLSRQPDIVWGEMVLPNFDSTAEHVDAAYERLAAGDYTALGAASGVRGDFKGVGDYLNGWMPEPFKTEYDEQWSLAMEFAPKIGNTAQGTWKFGSLYYPTWAKEKENWEIYWRHFSPPDTWPIYRLNTEIQVKTGEKIPRSGVYLPKADESCPKFLIEGEGYLAWEALVGLDGFRFRSKEPTLWTLVERMADEGGPVPGEEPWRLDSRARRARERLRCEGGQPCPADGAWWTPASHDKGHGHFRKGDILPDFPCSPYGATIWYRREDR